MQLQHFIQEMRAGIQCEISIIMVLEDNAFMTDSLKRKFQVQWVGDADTLVHYLEWESSPCVYSCFICTECENEYFHREIDVLDDLSPDAQTQFLHKGLKSLMRDTE